MDMPASRASMIGQSTITLKFADLQVACPSVFFKDGYTADLIRQLSRVEKKIDNRFFEIWYKLFTLPPDEPQWILLEDGVTLPPDTPIVEWKDVDPHQRK